MFSEHLEQISFKQTSGLKMKRFLFTFQIEITVGFKVFQSLKFFARPSPCKFDTMILTASSRLAMLWSLTANNLTINRWALNN